VGLQIPLCMIPKFLEKMLYSRFRKYLGQFFNELVKYQTTKERLMVTLDIVIVNWNSGELLRNCLNSIGKSNQKGLLVNIIVIDNNSKDGSLDKISSTVNYVRIKQNTNIGFAKACNVGLLQSRGEYVLFLNPDTEVRENTFQKAVTKMNEQKNIAVLGVKYINDSGNIAPSCSRFPKVRYYFYDIIGLSKLFPKIFFHATLIKTMNYLKSAYVDEVSGAFFFCRKSVIDELGGFDERFFVYYEELDLAYRIKQIGGEVFYDADNEIYHKGGGLSEKVKAKRLFYSLRSRIQYSFKNFKRYKAIILFVLTLFVEPFSRLLYLIINGRVAEIRDLFVGYFFLFRFFISKKNFD
jgi:N-acetylglucosaminyl-diphospho-decaprenol L-rhamnosyltransferase